MSNWFYWGETNKVKDKSDGWKRRTLKVDDINYGHSPDKRGERTDKWGKAPIYVKRSRWSGLVAHDGNDRLYYAKQRGDKYIEAWVKDN